MAFSSNPVNIVEAQTKGTLVDCLTEMFEEKRFTDITIVCKSSQEDGGTKLEAHKTILVARSPVFRSKLYDATPDNKIDELVLDDVDPDIFSKFLRYLYSDKVSIDEESAISLLEICQRFKVTTLFDECINHLKTKVRPDNACRFLALAFKHRSTPLCRAVCIFIDENADKVLDSDGFMEQSHVCLKYVLEGDAFYARETKIFTRAVAWAERQAIDQGKDSSDGAVIRNILGDAFFQLRLPTLSIEDFSAVTRRKGYFSLEEVEDIVSYIARNGDIELPCSSTQRKTPSFELTLRPHEMQFSTFAAAPQKANAMTTSRKQQQSRSCFTSFAIAAAPASVFNSATTDTINKTCCLEITSSLDLLLSSVKLSSVLQENFGLKEDGVDISGWIQCNNYRYRHNFNKAQISTGTVELYPPMALNRQTYNISITIRGTSWVSCFKSIDSFQTDKDGSAEIGSVRVSAKNGQPKLVTGFTFQRLSNREIPWAVDVEEKHVEDDSDSAGGLEIKADIENKEESDE